MSQTTNTFRSDKIFNAPLRKVVPQSPSPIAVSNFVSSDSHSSNRLQTSKKKEKNINSQKSTKKATSLTKETWLDRSPKMRLSYGFAEGKLDKFLLSPAVWKKEKKNCQGSIWKPDFKTSFDSQLVVARALLGSLERTVVIRNIGESPNHPTTLLWSWAVGLVAKVPFWAGYNTPAIETGDQDQSQRRSGLYVLTLRPLFFEHGNPLP
jgi:hypothetical protein